MKGRNTFARKRKLFFSPTNSIFVNHFYPSCYQLFFFLFLFYFFYEFWVVSPLFPDWNAFLRCCRLLLLLVFSDELLYPLFFSILFYCSFLLLHGRDDTVVLVVMVNLLMVIFLIICWDQMGWKHLILTELVCIRNFFTPMRPRINGLLEVGAVSLLEWSFG